MNNNHRREYATMHRTYPRLRLQPITRAVVIAFGLAGCSNAMALSWNLGDVKFNLDSRVSAGMLWRTEGPSKSSIGRAYGGTAYSDNIQSADLAYPAGNLVYQTDKITSAFTATYKNFGVFARANYTYDPSQVSQRYLNPNDYGAGHVLSQADRAAQEKDIRDHLASDGTVLDLYGFGSVSLMGHDLSFKVGKQIVNWGESTLVLNGLNSIVPLDADKARLPGAELSEFVVPTQQLFASFTVNDSVSVEGWYQWKWEPTLVGTPGSFFPVPDQDFVTAGGIAADTSFGAAPKNLASTTILRAPDNRPGSSPEFGAALRTFISALNDTELDFYAARYHSRLPVYSVLSATSPGLTSTANYFAEYPEDIQMYGVSFNTSLPFGIGFQGEYSIKPNQPLQLSSVELNLAGLGLPSQVSPSLGGALGHQYIRGFRRKMVSQIDFGFTKLLAPSQWFGYDDMLIIGEVAADRVHNLESTSQLRYEGPHTFQPGDAASAAAVKAATGLTVPVQPGGYPTANSWGYKLIARATYNNVLPGITLTPSLLWSHDVGGITPLPIGNFVRNSRSITVSTGWRYLNNLTGEVGYTTFFGGGQDNLYRDRDYIETYVRYVF